MLQPPATAGELPVVSGLPQARDFPGSAYLPSADSLSGFAAADSGS
ncbi:hypothetical protein ACIQ7Q_31185 [Streptomyces sp. NPDC096176]